jgi:hypothetical protein
MIHMCIGLRHQGSIYRASDVQASDVQASDVQAGNFHWPETPDIQASKKNAL